MARKILLANVEATGARVRCGVLLEGYFLSPPDWPVLVGELVGVL
jgi:hypothetical protein